MLSSGAGLDNNTKMIRGLTGRGRIWAGSPPRRCLTPMKDTNEFFEFSQSPFQTKKMSPKNVRYFTSLSCRFSLK
jgi:hypothetical protein